MTRIATIIAMRSQGMTMRAIGTEFGITKERVRQLLVGAGVSAPGHCWDYWSEQQTADLRAGLAAGLSAAAIGRAIGKTRNAVISKAHRLAAKPPNPATRTRPKLNRLAK
jgi:GcrA cell cycle regulator